MGVQARGIGVVMEVVSVPQPPIQAQLTQPSQTLRFSHQTTAASFNPH